MYGQPIQYIRWDMGSRAKVIKNENSSVCVVVRYHPDTELSSHYNKRLESASANLVLLKNDQVVHYRQRFEQEEQRRNSILRSAT